MTNKLILLLLLFINIYSTSYAQQEIKFFIKIDLSEAKLFDDNKDFKAVISNEYFTKFTNDFEYLQYFNINNDFHITLFSGSAFPVQCKHNNCKLSETLHHYRDTAIVRNQLQNIFQNSVEHSFNKLEVDNNLTLWTVPYDNFHQCFLLLKLSSATQNNIFSLQQNFFNNFKKKVGSHIIKGGKINDIQFGFYLKEDILRKKSISKFKKNKSAVLCVEKNHCYLITSNPYYRMPVSSIDNSPIAHKLTSYHITLSESNNYKKIIYNNSSSTNNTEIWAKEQPKIKKQILSAQEINNIKLDIMKWNINSHQPRAFNIKLIPSMLVDDTIP